MNRLDHGYAAAVSSWEDDQARACAEAGSDPEDSRDCIHGVPLDDLCEDCGWADEDDEEEEALICPADSHDITNECGIGEQVWLDGRPMCSCHDEVDDPSC